MADDEDADDEAPEEIADGVDVPGKSWAALLVVEPLVLLVVELLVLLVV